MPSLSIIIPTKNEAAHLPGLLASIRRQTVRPLEIIVADAQSTDATREIARAAGATVVEGGLPGIGRNAGAAVARGEILLFLDADEVLASEMFLERGISEILRNGYDIATLRVRMRGSTRVDRAFHGLYNTYVRACGARNPHAAGCCIWARKSLHERINGFDPTVLFCEDHDYARRAVRAGARWGFLRTISISLISNRRQMQQGRLRMALLYTRAELHLIFKGPIRDDRFRYGFDYKK